MRIKVLIITKSTGEVKAELTDEHSPNTFKAIVNALPIEAVVNKWGNEIYFTIPVNLPEENPKEIVEKGTIAYWPPGNSLCIFWGPTPASRSPEEIRPASPVNVVGKILDKPEIFDKVKPREKIRIIKV